MVQLENQLREISEEVRNDIESLSRNYTLPNESIRLLHDIRYDILKELEGLARNLDQEHELPLLLDAVKCIYNNGSNPYSSCDAATLNFLIHLGEKQSKVPNEKRGEYIFRLAAAHKNGCRKRYVFNLRLRQEYRHSAEKVRKVDESYLVE